MSRHRAPAKVNLRLAVLAREDTGYHQIETLFCALELADELEIEPSAAGITLDVEGEDVGPTEQNLVYRAARAFHGATTIAPAVHITLRKHIPAGAGLGGGSSDAATTLRALNDLHGRPLDDARLFALGAALGSDVPFFLTGAPLALAWGRGERLLPLPALPQRPVLVVVPRERMSTAEAYAELARRRATDTGTAMPSVVGRETLADWGAITAGAGNDFEPIAFERLPGTALLRDALLDAGAALALLSGSGSAVFGVFQSAEDVDPAQKAIASMAMGAMLIVTRTGVAPEESEPTANPGERSGPL